MLNNKSILITGGTGSLGHELTSLFLRKYKKLRKNKNIKSDVNPSNGY